jgi:hypothetical protein
MRHGNEQTSTKISDGGGGRAEDQLYRCLAVFSCNIAIIRCQRFAAAQLKP